MGGTSVIRNRVDQNGRSNYAGFVNFNMAGNNRTTGNAFAMALLGNFRTYSKRTAIRSASSASRRSTRSSPIKLAPRQQADHRRRHALSSVGDTHEQRHQLIRRFADLAQW